ncbi:hypothetical protein GOBAR_AA32796 [Gossypium barbadense]|uniref:Uncharacterized protein n=1 Tax=Gossypium barbadense TaxID=3634 RepID=A0A2P5W9X3_GOSBA|nr:hypothetical protein GOBAR_AA32796 [Gossypium barbadense]
MFPLQGYECQVVEMRPYRGNKFATFMEWCSFSSVLSPYKRIWKRMRMRKTLLFSGGLSRTLNKRLIQVLRTLMNQHFGYFTLLDWETQNFVASHNKSIATTTIQGYVRHMKVDISPQAISDYYGLSYYVSDEFSSLDLERFTNVDMDGILALSIASRGEWKPEGERELALRGG